MAVTNDDGTVKAQDLAEFMWSVEYDAEAYPWATRSTEERFRYIYMAEALIRKFEIEPR